MKRTKYDEISDLIFDTIDLASCGEVCAVKITFEQAGENLVYTALCCANKGIEKRPIPFLNKVSARLDSRLSEMGGKVIGSDFKDMYFSEEIEYSFFIGNII